MRLGIVDAFGGEITWPDLGDPRASLLARVDSIAALDEARGYRLLPVPRRHGGDRRLLTPDRGWHSVSMPNKGGSFIDTFMSLAEPPSRTLRRESVEQVAVLQAPHPASDEYEFIRPEIVQVKAAAGEVLYGRLVRPARFDPGGKYPAVVLVYGGPHAQSVCECYTGMSSEQALAQRGFVVWQLDSRGTAHRGHEWEAKLFRRFGMRELADQEEGIRHLVTIPASSS